MARVLDGNSCSKSTWRTFGYADVGSWLANLAAKDHVAAIDENLF